MKRRLAILLIVAVLTGCVGSTIASGKKDVQSIEIGMRANEVEMILGAPIGINAKHPSGNTCRTYSYKELSTAGLAVISVQKYHHVFYSEDLVVGFQSEQFSPC